MDDELLTLKAAGKLVGKSASTVRRWVRGGKLDRHEGVQVSGGGSPPVMVAKQQLLAVAGIVAGVQVSEQVSDAHVQPSVRSGVQVSSAGVGAAVTIAQLGGEVATLRAQLEAMTERLERQEQSHEGQLRDLRQTLHDTRQDLSDWRDRHDQRAAELRALRNETGRSWWRRLLPGPSAPSDEL